MECSGQCLEHAVLWNSRNCLWRWTNPNELFLENSIELTKTWSIFSRIKCRCGFSVQGRRKQQPGQCIYIEISNSPKLPVIIERRRLHEFQLWSNHCVGKLWRLFFASATVNDCFWFTRYERFQLHGLCLWLRALYYRIGHLLGFSGKPLHQNHTLFTTKNP